MPYDLKALLHNKPALVGIGVAGAAGLYVFLKRKKSGSTSGAGVAGGQTPYTVPGSYPDTTSTELVQQWGQFSQNLLADLHNQFPGSTAPNGGSGGVGTTIPPTGTVPPFGPPLYPVPVTIVRGPISPNPSASRIMYPLAGRQF